MPVFSPELIAIMRAALEQAMTKVPPAKATSAIKAHLAQSILRAAAQGETSRNRGGGRATHYSFAVHASWPAPAAPKPPACL